MKKRGIYFLILILFLSSNLIVNENTIFLNKQNCNDNSRSCYHIYPSYPFAFEWNTTWGTLTENEYSFGVAIDSSENVYIAGVAWDSGGRREMALVKYDTSGTYQWNSTWGGLDDDHCAGLAVDSSDNIYITGYTESFTVGGKDMVLVKYNSSGNQIWNVTWGGADEDYAKGIAIDSLNNIYVVGTTRNFGPGDRDYFLIKYNSSGSWQWNITWGGTDRDYGNGVAVDSSDNIYIVGWSYGYEIALVKYDDSGNQMWNCSFSGDYNVDFNGIAVDSQDNIYISGTIFSLDSICDLVMAKYDNSGNQIWNLTCNGKYDTLSNSIAIDSLDNIYLVAQRYNYYQINDDIILLQYTNHGEQIWNTTLGNKYYNDQARAIAIDSVDNVYIAGATSIEPDYDIFLVKYRKVPDLDKPQITIHSPSQGAKFGDNAPEYNISIIEPNLESFWYTIDEGITNFSISQFSGTINQTAWDAVPYGIITIRFYAKDLAENIGYKEIDIEKVEYKEGTAISGYLLILIICLISIISVIRLFYFKRNKIV